MSKRIKRKPDTFATALSDSLKQWVQENGIKYGTNLGDELNVKRTVWGSLYHGMAVASNTEIYAKLFLRTRLPEADPRKIPDRQLFTPKGKAISLPRNWSETEWLRFLVDQHINPSTLPAYMQPKGQIDEIQVVRKETKPTSPRSSEQASLPPTLGAFVDEFVSKLAAQISAQIQLPGSIATASSPQFSAGGDISDVLKQFESILQKLWDSSPDDRDNFFDQYGVYLGNIRFLLEPLTLPSDKREASIKGTKEMNT